MFNFDNAFELHNDIDVLKKMGLDCGLHSGTYTEEDIKAAKSMLPKALGHTLEGVYICPIKCITSMLRPFASIPFCSLQN